MDIVFPLLDALSSISSIFVSNKELDDEVSTRLLRYSSTKLIKSSMIFLTPVEDMLVWTKTSNDSFSHESPWEITRERGLSLLILKKIGTLKDP